MKYIPHDGAIYNTNFTDDILSTEWNDSELKNDDLKNYKAKAEFYVRQHQDTLAIAKLKSNVPLTKNDISELEKFSGAKSVRKKNILPNTAKSLWVSLCVK